MTGPAPGSQWMILTTVVMLTVMVATATGPAVALGNQELAVCNTGLPPVAGLQVGHPDEETAPSLAAWLGAWQGSFAGVRPAQVVVERIENDGFIVAYRVAAFGSSATYVTRSRATLVGTDQLRFQAGAAFITLTMAPEQDQVQGEFNLNGTVTPVSMTRCALADEPETVARPVSTAFRDETGGFPDPFVNPGSSFGLDPTDGSYVAESTGAGGYYQASRTGQYADVDVQVTLRLDPSTPSLNARGMLGVRFVLYARGIHLAVNPTTGTAVLNEIQFADNRMTGLKPLGDPVSVGMDERYRLRVVAVGDRLTATVNDVVVGSIDSGMLPSGTVSLGVQGPQGARVRMLFSDFRLDVPNNASVIP